MLTVKVQPKLMGVGRGEEDWKNPTVNQLIQARAVPGLIELNHRNMKKSEKWRIYL